MIRKNNFVMEIENLNNKKYCVLKLDEVDKILKFEINMIKNNISLPFLEIEIVQVDETKKMLYELGSKISFLEVIAEKKYNVEKIFETLQHIYTCLINLKEYMLENRKVILDYEYIFLDENLVPYMLYVPLELKETSSIEKEFNELCTDILKEIKKHKYTLTSSDNKMLNRMSGNRIEFDEIKQLFIEYKKKKEEEKLLSKSVKLKEVKINDEVELIKDKSSKSEIKKELHQKHTSVIEEDYSIFDGLEDDEDLDEYLQSEVENEEYKDIYLYDKKIDSGRKNKNIVTMQLIVLMLLGSIGLIISYEDKKIFTLISITMAVVIVIFTIVMISSNKKNKE
ncbi:DUF6382 domain-containing protein [Clostridium gasigenes]|uniref:DUF6382 domain-containing protein n=1 Tax=Clostridium gasigenes TaxID=94869 RepID=A0A7X0VTC5_9CLOT|nr:DUF6382 domain-containing protein [Clostridium gasigenes]MBB6716655.1 hypothetical protein [Clostridium gasigenes]